MSDNTEPTAVAIERDLHDSHERVQEGFEAHRADQPGDMAQLSDEQLAALGLTREEVLRASRAA